MTKNEYLKLQEQVKDLAKAYYDSDAPKVSDDRYDDLMRQIKAAEKEHPDWVTNDSITQMIGGTVSTKFQKVQHDVPMLSIEDVFDKASVEEWMLNVRKVHPDATFSIEEKIDGLSCTLRYKLVKKGSNTEGLYRLILAETRGNGMIGEDITENALQIDGVPAEVVLETGLYGTEFQIRGEVYMPTENFERYNQLHPDKPAANARNLAAGTLRQKDASLVKERGLRIYIFNVQKVEGADPELKDVWNDHYESLNILNTWIDTVLHFYADDFKGAEACIDQFEHMRGHSGYDIDGAVVKINQVNYRDDFKGTAKYSAGHIAYKYPQAEKKAEVTDIEIGIGRTGKLSFTAVVRDADTKLPLQMCGTEVSRVTVNNMDYIRTNCIGIGGIYGIIKSGEIIPKLTGTVYKEPEKIYEVPDVCPFCGEPIVNKGSVDYFCSNEDCPERYLNYLEYFCGRNQMNIEGVSKEMLRELLERGFLEWNGPAALYYMANEYHSTGKITNGYGESLEGFAGWGKTSIENMVAAINKSRKTTFERVLVSETIPNIGHGQVKLLKRAIEKYATENQILSVKGDRCRNYFRILLLMFDEGYDFKSIEGFGEVIVANLCSWITNQLAPVFDIDEYEEDRFVYLYKVLEIEPIPEVKKDANTNVLEGLTFCCTGSITKFKNRDELYAWIENLGGKTTGSVSKKTSYLINNDVNSASSKNKKAKELEIPIITEEELLAMRKEV